ncbi:MAG: hypothetical protein E7596_02365 [Ruminococcaceae bacterium]|nr:hypothetical protein [Oscillospiraceae bacterium]
MTTFEKFIHFFEGEMTRPGNYGWFHLMFVAIVVAATVMICIGFKNCSDKTFRRIMLACWVVMAALEIYKQVIYTFECNDAGVGVWDYQWYAFPYQLCSTPLYVLPFIAFLRDNGLREAFASYMSFFSLFGGLAVFFYPNDVFIQTIGINIQTMVHHGLQIVLGIFCTVYYRKKCNLKHYLKSVPVFASLTAVAIVLNEAVYAVFAANGIDETFNMFYISRHFDCTLPILSNVYTTVPYIVFALIYILGFALVSFILYLIQRGIIALVNKKVRHAE